MLIDDVLDHVNEQIHLKETMKKLPKFNVIYSVDLVQEVNSISIRNYD